MSKYWTDKQEGVDEIVAEDFNEAFSLIDTDMQKLDNLNDVYVFIGSFGNIIELPTSTEQLNDSVVPVFNYLGEQTTFEQPYNHNPYDITLLDMGFSYPFESDTNTHGYFDIPENEAILFKVGMEVELHMDMEQGSIHDVVYAITFQYNEHTSSFTARIWMRDTEFFTASVDFVTCFPTATFRTGDNIAIIEVAGSVFYEVLSHDYGAEIEALQEEHQYLNNQIGEIEEALQEIIEIQDILLGVSE